MTASDPAAPSSAVASGPSLAMAPAAVEAPVRAPWSSAAALWALIVLAVFSPWPFGAVEPWAVRTMTLVALFAACGAAIDQARRGGLVRIRWPLWPLIALVVVAVVQLVPLPPVVHALIAPGSYAVWHPGGAASAVLGDGARPISIDPAATRSWLAFAGGLALLAALAVPAASEVHTAVRASAVLVASGVAVAAYGVVARVLYGPLLYGHIAVPTIAPFGPFVSKNHFAGYVEMTALLALGLALGLADHAGGSAALDWVRSDRAWQPLAAFFGFAMISLGLLVSLSRGGMIGLLAGLALFFVVRWRIGHRALKLKAALPMLAAAAVLAGLLALLPGETHERISSLANLQTEQSAPFRLRVWRDALRAFTASPVLGWGAGAFADAFARVKSAFGSLRVEHAENEYVEVLVETGAVGAGLLLTAVVLGFRCALRAYRQSKHRLFRRLGPGALAAVGALLVHGLFDFNLHIPSNAALFAAVAVLAVGAGHPTLTRLRPGPSLAVVGAAAVLLLATLRPPAPPSASYADGLRAAASPDATARRLRMVRAEEGARAQLARRPADPASWLLLAWLRAVQGKPAEAEELARHALALDPQNPEIALQAARLSDGGRRAAP